MITHGEAIDIVTAPFDTALFTPIATRPDIFGRLKVVDPSPAPYVLQITQKRAEYVLRDTADQSQRRYPVGAEAVDHIITIPVGFPEAVIGISTPFTFAFPVPLVTRFISPFVCSFATVRVVFPALQNPIYALRTRFISHSKYT